VLELKKLRRLVGDGLPVFIGGAGAMTIRSTTARLNTFVGIDLIDLRDKLESLAGGATVTS
jgi:hypothetical protein